MIRPSVSIKGKINSTINLDGKTDASIVIVRPELEEIEIMPNVEQQEFVSDKDGFSKVIVNGDEDLKPENIKKGISIFGVNGEVVDTTDGDATEEDIKKYKVAYVNNRRVVGNMPSYNAMIEGNLTAGISTLSSSIVGIITKLPDELEIEGDSTAGMFAELKKIEKIPEIDTSKVSNMNNMFYNCTSLKEIPSLDCSKATTTQKMFYNCTSLETIPELNTSKVGYANEMFYNCKSLKNVSKLTFSPIRNVNNLFSNCLALEEISGINFIGKYSILANKMFYNCKALKEICLTGNTGFTSTTAFAAYCESITSFPLISTSLTTNMSEFFIGCSKLETIPELDVSSVTNMQNFVSECPNLNDESLNNILAMCTKATKITNASYKTLKYIGLTEEQAERCQNLSNYEAFLDAGWTTGY